MKTIKKLLLFLFFSGLSVFLVAQEDNTAREIQQLKEAIQELKAGVNANQAGESGFLLRGYAHSGLQATNGTITFEGGVFQSPIHLQAIK